MAPKRATFYGFGDDNVCEETKKFITDAGVLLTVRDLTKEPFSVRDLKDLIGHIDVKHFLNTTSPDYIKMKLDEKLNDLDELFPLIAENNSVLRRPIIRTARLVTVGCDKKKLAEMLQISHSNGKFDDSKGNLKNSKYVTRRDTTKSTPEKTETAPVSTTKSVSTKPETSIGSTSTKSTSAKPVTPSVRATK